ncbi:MAG: hypothetical protein AABO58_05855 [Acidobacteriota bacterium]
MRLHRRILALALMVSALAAPAFAQCEKAKRVVTADVVAFDQHIMLNRIGASLPTGMIFALKRDVIAITGKDAGPGNARLRPDKRPRPLVLRVNQYDCLDITFTNWLSHTPINPANDVIPPITPPLAATQTGTRAASIHINGMQLYQMSDDGSWVGKNTSSMVKAAKSPAPGEFTRYQLYATEQGTFLLYSLGANFGGVNGTTGPNPNGGNDGAQQTEGLFGALHVEPPDAEWYRSQVTRADLEAAWTTSRSGKRFLDYGKERDRVPILRMYKSTYDDKGREIRELVHTDLTAVITGQNHGRFKSSLYPCNNPNGPDCPPGLQPPEINPNFEPNYAEPDREQPYREFTILYHELFEVTQAFQDFYIGIMATPDNLDAVGTLASVSDQFAINYGTGGIGAEILANRMGVGPMGGCPDCKYEEFFLDSWTAGDPSMIVDVPANSPCPLDTLYAQWAFTQVATSQNDPPNGGNKDPVSLPCDPKVDEGTKLSSTGDGYLMLPKRKATKAYYPDDPSNVYHSYLNDHVKFRILHAGTGFSHVHHQHAHQWLRSPNNNESTYLDSQLINPGSAYTLDITFGGSGNRNKTPGDSIFHCHFYPHFAGGMWSLWRVHDTFEPGTLMNGDVPATGYARALPDAEIFMTGTPTPAIVPMPTLAMAPWPADVKLVTVTDPANPNNIIGNRVEVKPSDLAAGKNPGYPFFVPGISGVRSPHPPLDFAVEKDGEVLNGGLPRHLFLTGLVKNEQHNRYDFSKDLGKVNALHLPEEGTAVEQVAMKYHEKCAHKTLTPEGQPGEFETNGLKRRPGAPYADPGSKPYNPNKPPPNFGPKGHTRCEPIVDPEDQRQYRAAVFQTDLVFNKQGWHYPQSRMLALWEDVMPTLKGDRPPEPLFFRTDTDDVTDYWHTNLAPDYYMLDDYQVRTPTDIIGQHIHLVKFDVTSSDGASNGWNYEDGTFSPNEVRARIQSINQCGGLLTSLTTAKPCGQGTRGPTLNAKKPPKMICGGTDNDPCPADESWNGAQTTVSRWMADPLKSPAEGTSILVDDSIDRTLRTVFTHDHFGPSTHQQTGLYAAFVIEPEDTEWFHSETGEKMGTRPDGGPTSWQAVIEPKDKTKASDLNVYREFAIGLQDFQLAYLNGSINKPATPIACDPKNKLVNCEWADPANAVSQSAALSQTPLNQITADQPVGGPPPTVNGMAQQGVSAGPSQGTYTFNYRNEPLPYRLQTAPTPPQTTPPLAGAAIDPSYVFASNIQRNNTAFNIQPAPGAPINCPQGAKKCSSPDSSFTFPQKPLTFDMQDTDPYTPLLRAYEGDNVQVRVIVGAHMLPHPFTMQGVRWLFEPGDTVVRASEKSKANSGYRSNQAMGISEHFEFLFQVPKSQPRPGQTKPFTDFLYMPDSSNPQGGRGITEGTWGIMRAYQTEQPADKPLRPLPTNKPGPPLQAQSDENAPPWWWAANCKNVNIQKPNVWAQNITLKLNSRDGITLPNAFVYSTTKNATTVTEPLILRANAGDCIQLTLFNNIAPDPSQTNSYPSGSQWKAPPIYTVTPSMRVGLNAALLSYDVAVSSGTNIGWNPTEATVPVGGSRKYFWYAGIIDSKGVGTPVEFGSVNLTPSDPLQQDTYGLVGALIIEPQGSSFVPDTSSSQASGKVLDSNNRLLFQEFVLVTQDNLNKSVMTTTSPTKPTQVALNYTQEPMAPRFGNPPNPPSLNGADVDLSQAVSNSLVGNKDPVTPVFNATAGTPVRIRLLHPGGASDQQVFTLHGHIWQDEPFLQGSTVIGWNPESPWIGSRDLYGANSSYEIVIPSAGGANKVQGDYLYRTHPANFFSSGLWGILRVGPPPPSSGSGGGGGEN